VRAGELVALDHGVFLVRGAPSTYVSRLWAAVLSVGGVLGFATAAHLHGCVDEPAQIHIIRSDRDHIQRPIGVRTYRIPVPPDEVVELDGLPVTSRRWSLLDVLGRMPRADAGKLADRALQRSWLTLDDLERRLRRWPGRTGNVQLRYLLARALDRASAESERRLHRLLDQAGLHGWVANHQVVVDGRVLAVVDVAFPDLALAVEIDGWAFHSDVERFQRDRTRQNELVALGWTVLRFTWADVVERPRYVIATISSQIRASNVD
jgi:very-short-patch-repair endonuclease